MKSNYKMKKDYCISQGTIEIVLEVLKKSNYKNILYIGYADKEFTLSLHVKCTLVLFDWFDRTNTAVHYWEEDEEFLAQYPIPKWVPDNISFASGMGLPESDLLILDIPIDFDIEEALGKRKKLPKMVILLGDADSNNVPDKYEWIFEGLWVGRIV